jgi:flagella basal body P-ring formation protein FlgA
MMHNVKIFFAVLTYGVLWLVTLSAAPALSEMMKEQEIFIKINETNLVDKDRIYLEDIAKIHAIDFLFESIGQISLGDSPDPGEIKYFEGDRILSIIENQSFLPGNIKIEVPERVYIKRGAQLISSTQVENFVADYLNGKAGLENIIVKTFKIRGLDKYPRGMVSFQVESSDLISKSGRLNGYIDVMIDEVKKDRLSISGSVEKIEQVLVAKRSIKKDDIITPADFEYQARNVFDLKSDFILSDQVIKGKMLRIPIRKGSVLTQSMLADLPLIKKGDVVSLVAQNDAMIIVTTGVSKEDGFENQLIKVENISSGRLIKGVVKSKSKVEVIY